MACANTSAVRFTITIVTGGTTGLRVDRWNWRKRYNRYDLLARYHSYLTRMRLRPALYLGWFAVIGGAISLVGCAGADTTGWRRGSTPLSPSISSITATNDVLPVTDKPALDEPGQIRPVVWQAAKVANTEAGTSGGAALSSPDEIPSPPGSSSRRKLGLREAIDTALARNPDAITARAGGPVNDATRVVTATYPWNPSVQVQVDPFARAEDGSSLQTRNQVIVTQTLELAHQSRYRRQAADAGWNQQRAVIAQSEWTAAVAAMRAYFEALYRKGVAEVSAHSADLQAETLGIVDRRFTAGLATPTERLTARVTARQTQRQAELANADYQTAVSALRTVLNLRAEDLFELDGHIETYRWLSLPGTSGDPLAGDACANGDAENTTEDSIDNRPDIVAARFAVATAQSNLDLAKANTIPNISTGPSYERDESGTLFFGVSAQMDLPVWNTGCPLVRQRSAELQQQLITLSQTRARAMLQLQAAMNRYTVARKMWQERSRQNHSVTNESTSAIDAFEEGQATILEVLSIQDALTQEQKSELDMFHEISQAAVDVVSALAIDPEILIQANADDSATPHELPPSR